MEATPITCQYPSVTVDVDFSQIQCLCDRIQPDFRANYDAPLDHLPFIFKATAAALNAFPLLNAGAGSAGPHLQIGVKADQGPKFPVIRDADNLSVTELACELARFAALAVEGHMGADDVRGGTFTVLDYGANGILVGHPAVARGQVAILGVGELCPRVVAVPHTNRSAVTVQDRVYLTLSYSAESIPGAIATRFLAHVKTWLETADSTAEFSA